MLEIFAKKKKKRSFTLIELLVVIAIIGILAGIVLVSLGGARAKARNAKRQSDIRQISLAQEMYYSDTGAYKALAGGSPGRTTTTAIGTYLDPLPKDPGGGTVTGCNDTVNVAYVVWNMTADGSEYCIWACLEGAPANADIFAASEKGTATLADPPTSLTCW